jgi:hypothetical protein
VNELVQKLTKEQPVVVSLRPQPTREGLKQALDRGWLHVKFTETRGGTELGVPIDRQGSDLSGADLDNGTGVIRISGPLTLDYVDVRLVAQIDIGTFQGTGHLEIVETPVPAAEAEPG